MTIEQITRSALALPEHERAALVHVLLDSLDGEEEPQEDVERAWVEEIQRRREQIHKGEVQMISRDEMRERIQKRLSEFRKA